MIKNNKGFSAVVVLLSLLLVTVIGFTGYYVYNTQKENNKEDNTQNTTSQAKETTTDQAEPATVDNQKYLVIKEWDVKIPLTKNIEDAFLGELRSDTYIGPEEEPTIDLVFISTKSAPTGCQITEDNYFGIGSIIRNKTNPTNDSSIAEEYKDINGYYYTFYRGNGGACDGDQKTGEASPAYLTITEELNTAVKNIKSI